MNKAVLISIQPKWCELIASGKKTIEVRKTKPKIPTPFKCYIYCTKDSYKGKYLHTSNHHGRLLFWHNPNDTGITVQPDNYAYMAYVCHGKVIGEFVCYRIDTYDDDTIHSFSHEDYCSWNDFELNRSCIHPEDFESYANGKWLYGWHISALKIYDKPKELGEFVMPSEIGCCNEGKCKGCKWLDMGNGFNIEDDCFAPFDTDEYKPLRRPPQSWCYVERLVGEQ